MVARISKIAKWMFTAENGGDPGLAQIFAIGVALYACEEYLRLLFWIRG